MRLITLIGGTIRELREKKHFLVFAIMALLVLGGIATSLVQIKSGGQAIPEMVIQAQAILSFQILFFLFVLTITGAGAAVIPSVLERGVIDLLLSKPVTRDQVLAGRLLGCATFGLIAMLVCALGTYLVTGFTHGVWLPALLTNGAAKYIAWLALHSMSALIGLTRRSTLAAYTVPVVHFVVFAPLVSRLAGTDPAGGLMGAVRTVAIGLHWLLPQTGSASDAWLGSLAVVNSSAGADASAALAHDAVFTLVAVALSIWLFRRKEL
jgi:ABC-type transport system involved in multi-copper enzyme maturation permease subunit